MDFSLELLNLLRDTMSPIERDRETDDGRNEEIPKDQSQYRMFVEETDESETTHDPKRDCTHFEYVHGRREIVIEQNYLIFYETKTRNPILKLLPRRP